MAAEVFPVKPALGSGVLPGPDGRYVGNEEI